jgi:hypothetical protein
LSFEILALVVGIQMETCDKPSRDKYSMELYTHGGQRCPSAPKSEQATAGKWFLEIPSPNLANSALAVSFSVWFPPQQRFGLWYYTANTFREGRRKRRPRLTPLTDTILSNRFP